MTDAERRELAMSIVDGKVFGTWNLREGEPLNIIQMIFMPLALGSGVPEGTVHVYDYLCNAGPRSINGYPMFFSCRFLLKEDAEAILPIVKKLDEQKQEFMDGKEGNNADTSERADAGGTEADRERSVRCREHRREPQED